MRIPKFRRDQTDESSETPTDDSYATASASDTDGSDSMDEFIVSDSDSEIYDTTDADDDISMSESDSSDESDEGVDDVITLDPNNIVVGKRTSRPPQRYSNAPSLGGQMIDDSDDERDYSSGSDYSVDNGGSDSDSDSDWE